MIAKYYQLLKEFIEIQGISLDNQHSSDIKKSAKRLKKIFEENKMDTKIIEWYWNPIIIADYQHNPKLPTCTIYWNYDVIQACKEDWRKEDPFSLYIWKENIYWRWVSDNKWQLLINMIWIFELIKEKNLWYNIRFFIEWEKNLWSENTKKFIIENKEKLQSDFFMFSDWSLVNENWCIWISTKWNIDTSLIIQTSNNQIDIWKFWWIVPNSIQETCRLISKLYWANNQINIPYFYYDVEDINFKTIINNKKIQFDTQQIQKNLSIRNLFKEKNFDYISQIWLRPTIQITSIKSWYNKETKLNTIQNETTIDLSFKTVKKQDWEKIIKSFKQRLNSNLPEYVDYEIQINNQSEWTDIDKKNKYFLKAESFLRDTFQKEVINLNMWITIPILNTITKNITQNILLIPMANQDCNSQSSNENLNIKLIEKWLLFNLNFFSTQLQLF